jgi:hypothetical protein
MEPDFLDRVTADTESTLSSYGLDESARAAFIAFDFSRIRNLGGFIAKVQHNYLWESFPGTLNLLKLTGLEIPVFSSYNRIHQRLRAEGSASRDEKIRRFLDYLDEDLSHRCENNVAILRAVLAHEEIMWRLAADISEIKAAAPEPAVRGPGELLAQRTDQRDAIVPSICGRLEVREFEFDPVAALSELERGTIDLPSIAPSSQHLGYWVVPSTRQIRVLNLGYETAVLLSEINGRQPVPAIIERTISVLGANISPDDIRSFLESAVREGLLQDAPGLDPNEDE